MARKANVEGEAVTVVKKTRKPRKSTKVEVKPKGFVEALKTLGMHLTASFTDGDWVADMTKILGFVMVVGSFIGWCNHLDGTTALGFSALGSGLVASGKFSSQG